MPVYDLTNPGFNISDFSQCIRHEDLIQMLPYLTLKSDAIKLGVWCFVAGILLGVLIMYLRQRYDQ
jgi:hypothetical protein